MDDDKAVTIFLQHPPPRFQSRINLVDLAGSEKVSKSLVTGQQLKEAIGINQSLTCLGVVTLFPTWCSTFTHSKVCCMSIGRRLSLKVLSLTTKSSNPPQSRTQISSAKASDDTPERR